MKEISIYTLSSIESCCTDMEQASNTLWFIIEALEGEGHGVSGATAAKIFLSRQEKYLDALYLIYRELTNNIETIRTQLEENVYKRAMEVASA